MLEVVTKRITSFLQENTIQSKYHDCLGSSVNLGRLLMRREDLLLLKMELEGAKTTINSSKSHLSYIN